MKSEAVNHYEILTDKSLTANVRSCNAELTFADGNNFIDILNVSTVIPRLKKQTTGYLNTPYLNN